MRIYKILDKINLPINLRSLLFLADKVEKSIMAFQYMFESSQN